jgi:hypothetical protein
LMMSTRMAVFANCRKNCFVPRDSTCAVLDLHSNRASAHATHTRAHAHTHTHTHGR